MEDVEGWVQVSSPSNGIFVGGSIADASSHAAKVEYLHVVLAAISNVIQGCSANVEVWVLCTYWYRTIDNYMYSVQV